MKKFLVLILLVSVCVLTGCGVKYDAMMSIPNDGNVTMSILVASDNETIDFDIAEEGKIRGKSSYTDEDRWDYLKRRNEDYRFLDYQKEPYEEGEYKGYQYTKELGYIDSLVGEPVEGKMKPFDLFEQESYFTISGDVYLFHFELENESGDLARAKSYQEMEDVNVLTVFRVALPQKALSHNATQVSEDGLTYTWDLIENSTIDLSFTMPKYQPKAQKDEKGNIIETPKQQMSLIPIFIFAIGAFMLMFVIYQRNKKNK